VRFNRAQRVVLVVALGTALWAGWSALDAATAGTPGGWANDTPNGGVIYSDSRGALQTDEWLRLAVQLGFVGVWLAISTWILAERPTGRRAADRGPAGSHAVDPVGDG
jgi:hypothetical protein